MNVVYVIFSQSRTKKVGGFSACSVLWMHLVVNAQEFWAS